MKRAGSLIRFLGKIEGLPVAFVLLLLYVYFMLDAPAVFLKYRIYISFLQTVAPPLILGLGLTFVITAGEIDLSFPAAVAFSGFVFTWGFNHFGDTVGSTLAPWAALVCALAAGALVGYVNGILVAKIGVPSIMATLAAQFFWYGVTVKLAGGLQTTLKNVDASSVFKIFVGRIDWVIPDQGRGSNELPIQALWAVGLAIFLWFILNRHRFGEAITFIGDNANVARVMGINVEGTRIRLFTMMGVIAAFAGVILTLQARVFYPTQGQGMLLPVMAAVFIGGTSIAGGLGLIVGTFFGSYIIGSLEAGVVAAGYDGFWTQLIQGLVMGASVVLNIIIGQGRWASVSEAFRRWGASTRSLSSGEDTPMKEDAPAH